MSNDKEQLQALLADYVEGSLSEQQIDEAEAYLAANPGVRTVVDRLMIDSEALRALPRQRAAIDFSEDFRAQAERDLLLGDAARPGTPTRSLGGPMLALAAMLVVGLGIGGAGYYLLAYRPATNMEFARVAAEQVAATEPAASASRDDRGRAADAVASTPLAAAAASGEENDGKAWDRAFGGGAGPARATSVAAAPVPTMMKATPASKPALPDDVRVAIEMRPTARGAFVIVVDDPSSLDTTRQLVRAAFAESAAGDAAANVVAAPAGGATVAQSPTTVPDGEVIARGVPIASVERLRPLFGQGSGASVYDVAPTTMPSDDNLDAAKAADEVQPGATQQGGQSQQLRQVSGTFGERAKTSSETGETVDVYVIARSPTTRAADRP